jgi:competence protein ComEC
MMIATHPDYDHNGGLVAILKSDVRVGTVMVTGIHHTSKTYEYFMQAIKDKNIPLRIPHKGEMLDWGDRVQAQVIAPQVPPARRMHRSLNNNSIVIRMKYNDISLLFTGDCEHEEEGEINNSGARIHSTIFHASHHGSRTGNGPDFYYLIDPELVVISAGKRNKFGHPHWESIKLFRETGARILRTDYSGTITIASDGKEYEKIKY